MSVVVVLLPDDEQAGALGPHAARALSRLGVTEATLADGPGGTAVVLAGWGFDGRRHEAAVVDLVSPSGHATVLHGVAEMELRPDQITSDLPTPSTTRRSS